MTVLLARVHTTSARLRGALGRYWRRIALGGFFGPARVHRARSVRARRARVARCDLGRERSATRCGPRLGRSGVRGTRRLRRGGPSRRNNAAGTTPPHVKGAGRDSRAFAPASAASLGAVHVAYDVELVRGLRRDSLTACRGPSFARSRATSRRAARRVRRPRAPLPRHAASTRRRVRRRGEGHPGGRVAARCRRGRARRLDADRPRAGPRRAQNGLGGDRAQRRGRDRAPSRSSLRGR